MERLLGLVGAFSLCVLGACSTKKVVESDAAYGRYIDFPSPRESERASIPENLWGGTATLFEVIEWSKKIIDDNPSKMRTTASFIDFNADGLSEVLVEIPWASGVNGNRSLALFLASPRGYRYVAIISRVADYACYLDGQACYATVVSGGGQYAGIGLLKFGVDSVDGVAGCRTGKFDNELNSTLLYFPDDHRELLRNYGLGPEGKDAAKPGCKPGSWRI
ncbi:MAG: hypothetical protein AAFR91_13500 [Pseudomonadota bacterium]